MVQGGGRELLRAAGCSSGCPTAPRWLPSGGVTTAAEELPAEFIESFVAALAQHRVWRETDAVLA